MKGGVSTTTNTTRRSNRFEETVIIVGGGPSGASAAKAMADRGYTNVHLYEAYPHPKTLSKTSSKAYVIALSPRGQQGILDATGIDTVKEASSQSFGVLSSHLARHVYNPKTKKTSSEVRPSKGYERVVAKRQDLTAYLLEAAAESGVTIHYQHKLVDIDFEQRVAHFENGEKNGSKLKVSYDLLVASDGSRSKVRTLMVENQTTLSDFSARIAEDSMEYQVVVLPKNPFAETHPENTIHSWNNKELNAICLGFPVQNETNKNAMLFAIVFPEGKLESFRKTGYETPLKKLLPDVFQDENATSNLEEFQSQLQVNQIANGGLCVWSSSLGHGPSGIVLLGDSGHGMWPSLGQGANCALESVGVFVKCLDELDNTINNSDDTRSWTGLLIQDFTKARAEDATAAVDLTYGGIGARESRGRLNAPLSSKLQMIGMMLLHKLTLGVVPMPALLRILMGTRGLSYSTAKKFHFGYEKYICCWGVAMFALLVVAATRSTILDGSSLETKNSGLEL